jgi:shikimate kinase
MGRETPHAGHGPVLVEVIGPAGAGKSTLLRRAAEMDPSVVGLRLEMRKLPPAALLRMLRQPRGRSQGLFRQAVWQMAGRDGRGTDGLALLDEGPVYRLVRRLAVGHRGRATRALEGLGQTLMRGWAADVDVILWLDAPDPVLIERMRGRPKPHAVKARTDDEIRRFLQRYRECYREVLAEIGAGEDARVIRVDTGHAGPDETTEAVLAALGRRSPLSRGNHANAET